MRNHIIISCLILLVGCSAPKYVWRNAPGEHITLHVQTNFDPKMNFTPEAKKLYAESIHDVLSKWIDIASDSSLTTSSDVTLVINVSCQCKSNFLTQADATMDLISIFDRDSHDIDRNEFENKQRIRIGYDAEDMQGDIHVYSTNTQNHPYSSIFLKAHIMTFMEPLSADSKLIATNRSREQAKGLARLIVSDLQRINLLPPAPIR